MQGRRVFVLGCIGLLLIASSVLGASAPSRSEIARQIRFGADMARQGNWHEAIFRWQRALASDPQNPRLLNNLAVAHESLGAYDKAAEEYRAAAALPDAPGEIARNQEPFEKFYKRYKEAAPPTGEPAAEGSSPAKPQEPDAKAP